MPPAEITVAGGAVAIWEEKGNCIKKKKEKDIVVVSLREMIEQLDCTDDVPSVFICPISLEPMQDPVTLCTGQTYERTNILRWFSTGHYTCPTTMQELWDVSLTPNTTLRRLISKWYSQRFFLQKIQVEDVRTRIKLLLDKLRKAKGQTRVQTLTALRGLTQTEESAKKTMVEEGGISLLSSLLGPFTSHAVGSEAIGILVQLSLASEGEKFSCELVELLPSATTICVETGMAILEILSTTPEGRKALKDCSFTIPNIVGVLMRVSESCTQNALSILLAVCSLAPEECTSMAVEAGLAAKHASYYSYASLFTL